MTWVVIQQWTVSDDNDNVEARRFSKQTITVVVANAATADNILQPASQPASQPAENASVGKSANESHHPFRPRRP
jgi:hypothetical protein